MRLNNQGKLAGRTAIVTGASRSIGLGAAICKALAQEGADIFFTYWLEYDEQMPWGVDTLEQEHLREEILAMGVKCEHLRTDLSDTSQIPLLLNEVEHRIGLPSILVNNACYSMNDDFSTITAESLDAHYAINVRAVALLSVEFARRFNGKSGGRVISMTSGQFQGPMAGELSYATTKGAIDAFTKTFAAEVGHKGITVNAVNPGPTDTGWMTGELRQDLASRSPMGRVGLPQDAARLVAFLASDEAEWITGQSIHSTGGFA
ncbi:SDR family oxidoreductase [Paenibacillus oenotherae]|uniref:SDR family oxidoreductase n=1 Tax=Paenibacillus oenotherae TaxID=1435645 RepID=A0ABS7D611_9BACL|nr:SDR family oxidoreductase [Paenibacillus oenotherae]MBW7475320.1 SDR family oxidoreductase [Paenibacillus oenotherae]